MDVKLIIIIYTLFSYYLSQNTIFKLWVLKQLTGSSCKSDFINKSCLDLFEGDAVGSQPMERKGKKPHVKSD